MDDITKAFQANNALRGLNLRSGGIINQIIQDDIEKGKTLPVGTIKKRGSNNFIKTATGWKYHSRGANKAGNAGLSEKEGSKTTTIRELNESKNGTVYFKGEKTRSVHTSYGKLHVNFPEGSGKDDLKFNPTDAPLKDFEIKKKSTDGSGKVVEAKKEKPKTNTQSTIGDFDLNEINSVIEKRKKGIEAALSKHNEGKAGSDLLRSYDTEKPEVKAIREKVFKENPSKAIDAMLASAKAGGTEHIAIKFPEGDVMSYERDVSAARKSMSEKVKRSVSMINSEQSKAVLSKIDGAVKKLKANGDVWASIESHSAHTADGESGMFEVKVSTGMSGSSVKLQVMTSPSGAQIMNMQELQDRVKYSSFTNDNKMQFSKIVDAIGSAVGSGGSKVISFSTETKAKAQALISKRPSNTKYNTWQGSSVDNESGTITLYYDTDRAARHPEEYGAEGSRAEMIDHKFHTELGAKVIAPLEKLGYSVKTQAK